MKTHHHHQVRLKAQISLTLSLSLSLSLPSTRAVLSKRLPWLLTLRAHKNYNNKPCVDKTISENIECVYRCDVDKLWTNSSGNWTVDIAWLRLERVSQFGSHAGRVARFTDRFVWLGRVILLRRSRPPDGATGKPASMSRALAPALFEPLRLSSQALSISVGVKFIIWRRRRTFLGEYRRSPRRFWRHRACLGYGPTTGPTLEKA